MKSMWVNSADIDLDTYWPNDSECFGMWIEFSVGAKEADGADNFRLFVCTPEWLKNESELRGATWGRHMLILHEYDLAAIKAEVDKCVEQCTANDWSTIAQKISRFAAWEYEDYQP